MRFHEQAIRHVLALALFLVPAVRAEDIYKWTDDQGRVHYSNRGGGEGQSQPSDAPLGDEGWESALERKRGTEEFTAAADSAINSLQARMIRRKRERSRAQEALDATQADILRSQTSNPSAVPELRLRESKQIAEVRRLEAEISAIETQIARLRTMKAIGKEQANGPAPAPFGQ